jgi:hypothetical protein
MTRSFVLRLVPGELAHGRLVGRLRVVATGEERLFRDARELAVVAADLLRDADGAGLRSRGPAGPPTAG